MATPTTRCAAARRCGAAFDGSTSEFHTSTKQTKSLFESQEARGVEPRDVLGTEVGSTSRWNGMNRSLRRNNLLKEDLDGLAADLTFDEDTTVETVPEQKEFDRLVREAGTADLSDGDEDDKDDEDGVDDDELDEDDDEELDDEQNGGEQDGGRDAANDDDIDARRRRSHSSDDDVFDDDAAAATSARAASGAFPRAP